MSDRSPLAGEALFDFRAQYAADEALGRVQAVEVYARRFPGFEAEIAQEYAALAAGARVAAAGARADDAGAQAGDELERAVAHYRLQSFLGRGGQGAVYLANDTRLGRKVALKLLAGLSLFSPDARRRFQREAETASRLDHPGICTIYESGVDGELAYIAMRYVEGETLARRIAGARDARAAAPDFAQRFPCAPSTREQTDACLCFFEAAARALHAAHEAGVIHRDVKPGNLMITPEGEPVFLDFGLAREVEPRADAITLTGELLGTPGYMSPEQIDARGLQLDRRTDVYSLGVALYECLTLELPHQAPTLALLYQAILRDPPRDPRATNRSIPGDLAVVIETALEKDRDRRYVSALEFAEDLRRIREFEAIHARPPGVWLRSLRWVQRHPARTIACGAVLIVGGTLVFARLVSDKAGKLEDANKLITQHDAATEQENALHIQRGNDQQMKEKLLDLLADAPRRGTWNDWAGAARAQVQAYAGFHTPLDGSLSNAEIGESFARASARDAELGEGLLDGVYRLAWTFDDVEIGPRHDDPLRPRDLAAGALAGPEWSGLRVRVLALVCALERDAWRRDVWTAFRHFVGAHEDRFDEFLRPEALAQRSAADLLRLAELVYLVRRNDEALKLYQLAEQRPTASQGLRYAIRLGRGLLRLREGPQRDVPGALADLDVAHELRPHSAPTCVGLSRALWAKGERERALPLAREAVAADAKSASAQKLLANMLLSRGEWEAGEEAARHARELDANDPLVPQWLARARLSQRDEHGAFEAWQQSSALSPDPASAWGEAGRVLQASGYDESAFRTLVAREAQDDSARAGLFAGYGIAAVEQRQFEPATRLLEDAHELASGSSGLDLPAHKAWVTALLGMRKLTEARQVLDETDGAAADDAELTFLRACTAFQLGELAQAAAHAEHALELHPAYAEALRLLATVEGARGRIAHAFEARASLLALAPEDEACAGELLQLLGRQPRELALLVPYVEALRKQHPDSVAVAVVYAVLCELQGASGEARTVLEQAAARDPRRGWALAYLCDLRRSRSDLDGALEAAREAFAREPGCALARAFLARAWNDRGHPERALPLALAGLDAAVPGSDLWPIAFESSLLLGAWDPFLERGFALLRASPEHTDVAQFVLLALECNGRFEEVTRFAESALRFHPDDRFARWWRARAAFDQGRWAEATEGLAALASPGAPNADIDRMLGLARARGSSTPPDLRALAGATRARAAFEAGLFPEAARVFEEVLDADGAPADPELAMRAAYAGARAAETVWRSAEKDIAALPASSSDNPSASLREADEFAEHALGRLEKELDRCLAVRGAASLPPTAKLEELQGALRDRDLLYLRVPPDGAPWSSRAASWFWRLREALQSARRGS